MKPGTFMALGAVTVIAVAGAVFSTNMNNNYRLAKGSGQKVFPDLLSTINNIQSISILRSKSELTIERYPDRWGMASRGGYPVRAEAVRKLLLELTNLKQSDAKTRLKERYGRLDLGDIEKNGARSKKIILKNQSGKVINQLLVGKHALDLEGERGIYIRKPDEAQSWMAKGTLEVNTAPSDWLQKEIINVSPKRVGRVVIRHPGGETLAVSKSSPADKHFAIENMPSDVEMKSVSATDAIASVMNGLELDDVNKADGVPFADDKTIKATVYTFDGLIISVAVVENKGENWLKLSASSIKGGGEENDAKAAKLAGAINSQTKGWAYKLAAYKVTNLKKHLLDIVRVKK